MKWIFLVGFLALVGCSNDSQPSAALHSEDYCKNELKLITADSNLPKVDFGLMDESDKIIQKLDSIFPDDCGPYFYFAWQNPELKDLKLAFYNTTHCLGVPERATTTVLLNDENKGLLDYLNIIQLDGNEIQRFVEKDLIQTLENQKIVSDLIVRWSDGVAADSVKMAINQTIKGYLGAANQISKNESGKGICELNEEELIKIKEKFPFKLIFRQTYVAPEPPKVDASLDDE